MDETSITTGGNIGFIGHVFSTTEESKNEILNIIQYAFFSIIPIIVLNKSIQKFIPEADTEKSSIEIIIEIILQIIAMFVGIIIIHRIITYFPTYSGFKYERLHLTSIVIGFLIIILSLQTKIGIKTNILFERLIGIWNGTQPDANKKRNRNVPGNPILIPQQQNEGITQTPTFPPPPAISTPINPTPDYIMRQFADSQDIKPANDLVGFSFR